MLTYNVQTFMGGRRNADGTPRYYIEGTCLQKDAKPDNVDNGSMLREIDTSTLWCYDLENKIWRKW